MNKVAKRTVVGISAGALVVALFLYCPLKALPPILLVLSSLVQLEFYQLVRAYRPVAWFGLLMGAAWLAAVAAFPSAAPMPAAALPCGLVWSGFLLAALVLFRRRCDRPVASWSVTLAGFLYVPFLLSHFLRVVQIGVDPAAGLFAMPDSRAGLYTLLYLVASAKFSDTGGFAFGVAFGRHKMCPSISPNKSWEGLAGSMVFAAATGCVMLWISRLFGWADVVPFWGRMEYPGMALVGCGLALLATLGDLVESRFKRECGVKDSATFMPAGMGGFLDMFDSVLFLPALAYPLLAAGLAR